VSTSNPYESPVSVQEQLPPTVPTSVRAPALGLIVLGILALVGYVLQIIATGVQFLLSALHPLAIDGQQWLYSVVGMVLFLPTLTIVYGALNARKGKRYRWALASAILSCIPFVSPIIYLAIPFGIWLLIALLRQKARLRFTS